MLYILSNVKKSTDLTKVAAVVLGEGGKMHRLRRLMEQLMRRLEERRSTLGSDGLELLARSFFIAATTALEETDYATCKYYCLCGMDVMPAQTETIRPGDFLRLITACKERSVADRPIMNTAPVKKSVTHAASPINGDRRPARVYRNRNSRSSTFLRQHRTASELALRKLLGTRRVVGIVNRLIQKADSQGSIADTVRKGLERMVRSMNTPEPEVMDRGRLESINIINALRRGTVPGSGLERIAVGLEVEEERDRKTARLRCAGRR